MSDFTVVASVGTYHHPFERFVDWLEPWTQQRGAHVVFQHGSTRPIPGADNHEMLAPRKLLDSYRNADVVVLQGGAGGVMDARKAGRIPIVVPRRPVGNEVVDDHQVVLSRRLAELGLVHVAESAEELAALLDGVRAGTVPTRSRRSRPTEGVIEAVRLLSAPVDDRRAGRGPTVTGLGHAAGATQRPSGGRPAAGQAFLAARAQKPRRTPALVLADLVHQGVPAYLLTFLVAVVLSARLEVRPPVEVVSLVAVGAWLVYSFAAQPAYERGRSLTPALRFSAAVAAVLMAATLLGVENTENLRRGLVVMLAAAATFAALAVLHRRMARRTRTVLVGEEKTVRDLATRWADRPDVEVVSSCVWKSGAERRPMSSPGSLARVVPEVMAAVGRNRARSVVIASDHSLTTPALRHLAWALQRADVECVVLADMKDHVEYLRPRRVADQVALAMRPPNDHLASMIVKSLVDRGVALAGLLVLSPVMLAVALAVRLTSRGPAVFRQERTGLDGEVFTMLKFRTMVADAEERLADLAVYDEGAGPLFKLRNDPRITPVGRFLRRTSLDELPQLVNVLKGEMSLVGPRPALPVETAQYSQWVWRRLHVKPGITGLWQVSGRSFLTWEESIRIDLQYVNNWNLRLDASILLRTVRAVLARDGAL